MKLNKNALEMLKHATVHGALGAEAYIVALDMVWRGREADMLVQRLVRELLEAQELNQKLADQIQAGFTAQKAGSDPDPDWLTRWNKWAEERKT